MKKINVFESEAHFSTLIEQARKGETIIVTINGEEVAQIGPVLQKSNETAKIAMKQILASQFSLGGGTIRELLAEGRCH